MDRISHLVLREPDSRYRLRISVSLLSTLGTFVIRPLVLGKFNKYVLSSSILPAFETSTYPTFSKVKDNSNNSSILMTSGSDSGSGSVIITGNSFVNNNG